MEILDAIAHGIGWVVLGFILLIVGLSILGFIMIAISPLLRKLGFVEVTEERKGYVSFYLRNPFRRRPPSN